MLNEFYKGKRVLVTGHTGFKGAWMCHVLHEMGAEVFGYALEPPTNPNLYDLSGVKDFVTTKIGDVCDLVTLKNFFDEACPEIVIHMAAQPIVRESYKNPVGTYATNVMGTVNVLECVRLCPSVKSVVNVTTDKVYRNAERAEGYREEEELCGYDPYSNSKSCSELITDSYRNSFLNDRGCAVSTMRAGNVIGGGDFAVDRIVPDCLRAIERGEDIVIRNPHSTRPYQHVLEPVFAYLLVAMRQYEDSSLSGAYNVGPNDESCITTGDLVEALCRIWKEHTGEPVSWVVRGDEGPHEATFLKLDCTKIKSVFEWSPKWNAEKMLQKTVEWMKAYTDGADIAYLIKKQILEYCES